MTVPESPGPESPGDGSGAGRSSTDLASIVKANDIRGLVPEQLDVGGARALGAAFARWSGARRLALARDMRESGRELSAAFAGGAVSEGVDVVDLGLAATDELYYASGSLDVPGAVFTASHNPARYNGLKLCRAGALPIGRDEGLAEVQALAQALLDGDPAVATPADRPRRRGEVVHRDLLPDYAGHLRSLVPELARLRPLVVVVDCGNGMGGLTVPAVLQGLPLRIVPMFFELDGTFPNHEANPLEPANTAALRERVPAEGADLGLAFDGDADRCFVVDERGRTVTPSAVTALIAARMLAAEPGGVVIHNLITSRTVPEVVREQGGTAVRTRVGHAYVKAEMARTRAVFGGEHSGHFYFRDFWGADSGMLAALHVLAALGTGAGPLSALLQAYDRYAASGEINSVVADPAGRLAALRAHYASRPQDELDGLTVDLGDGAWFNVRPSNTEPLLRLNVEGPSEAAVAAVRDEVLALVRR